MNNPTNTPSITPAPSRDDSMSAHWQKTAVSAVNGFVVRDYTRVASDQGEPAIYVLRADQIFAFLEEAHRDHRPVAVYTIGARLLDLT